MGNIADTSIFQEMQEEMEDWFEYMDNEIFLAGGQTELIHEVNGEVVTEPLEDVLERENMVDDEEVDVITDHLDEIEQLEMEAELSVGI